MLSPKSTSINSCAGIRIEKNYFHSAINLTILYTCETYTMNPKLGERWCSHLNADNPRWILWMLANKIMLHMQKQSPWIVFRHRKLMVALLCQTPKFPISFGIKSSTRTLYMCLLGWNLLRYQQLYRDWLSNQESEEHSFIFPFYSRVAKKNYPGSCSEEQIFVAEINQSIKQTNK